MKDCKCGRIPCCYGGKKFRIHEELERIKAVDEIHDMVYELNKQMCDIGKTMSYAELMMDDIVRRAEENIRLYNDNNKYARLVRAAYESKFGKPKEKDIMEEKKTKKMTKAEAFEHLKGTKVFCKDYDKMEAVQDFLRSLGFYWGDASKEMVLTHTIFLHKDGRLSFALSLQYFREHESPELSADDILSIEIVEEKKVLSVDCALEHAKWIMKYLREECSPHTKMIIEGDHAELVEGVKSVVWKE